MNLIGKENASHISALLFFAFVSMMILFSCNKDDELEVKPKREPEPAKPFVAKSSLFIEQWYLKNTGSSSGNPGLDINITPVWDMGYTGKEMNIAVLDTYIDKEHPNLKSNIADVTAYHESYNFCEQKHGTPVTGIIAASNNESGTVGIAPNAKIYFHAINNSVNNNSEMADLDKLGKALSTGAENIAAYNCSWSYTSGGFYNSKILQLYEGFNKGTQNGFNGKGSVYVFASGNAPFYTLASDPILAHPAVIAVSGVKKNGEPHFLGSKKGLQHWLGAFSDDILTTDRTDMGNSICGYNKGDTTRFSGTSAAAPMVTAVVALMREANPRLTYRDVKLILAETAKIENGLNVGEWYPTGTSMLDPSKKYKYSEYLGFGLLDAEAAVKLAQKWALLPKQFAEQYPHASSRIALQKGTTQEIELNIENSKINFVEFVQISLDFISKETPSSIIHMDIIDPSGKEYNILNEGKFFGQLDAGRTPYKTGYNLYLGKHQPNGIWKIKIKPTQEDIEAIENMKITVYGH